MPRPASSVFTLPGCRPGWTGLPPLLRLVAVMMMMATTARSGIGGYSEAEAPEGEAAAFIPLNLDKVELLSLRCEITPHVEYADVFMECLLRNPGPAVTVTAGFPCAGPGEGGAAAAMKPRHPEATAEPPWDNRFKIQSDEGEPVYAMKLPAAPGHPATGWRVFRLTFQEGETRRLQIRCREPLRRDSSPDGRTAPLAWNHLLSAASAWLGPVRHGTVMIRPGTANSRDFRVNRPERFQRQEEGLVWNFSMLEPGTADDVTVVAGPGYESFPAGGSSFGKGAPLNEFRHFPPDGGSGAPGSEKENGRRELHRKDYSAVASSVLQKQNGIKYGPDNLRFDEGESTAWIEGAPRDGIGESVTLTLPEPARVSRIGFVNGYVKTRELYYANNRVAELDISLDGGKPLRVSLPDERLERERFHIDLPESTKPVKSVKLTIVSVYDGNRHEDTALSEVVLVTPLDVPRAGTVSDKLSRR